MPAKLGKILLPAEYAELKGPIIFLAGPIQGAPDWQAEAIKFIQEKAPEINITSPRNPPEKWAFVYEKQVDWESFHLKKASKEGAIMFWLAKEVEHIPDRAYAQTTRFELAEWKIRHQLEGARIVLGIEKGFTNEKYIRRRFGQDCPDVEILDSLEKTCQKAIEIARK